MEQTPCDHAEAGIDRNGDCMTCTMEFEAKQEWAECNRLPENDVIPPEAPPSPMPE